MQTESTCDKIEEIIFHHPVGGSSSYNYSLMNEEVKYTDN